MQISNMLIAHVCSQLFRIARTFTDSTSGKSVPYKRQTFKCKEEKQIS